MRVVTPLLLLALAGCGARGDLVASSNTPPATKAYGATATPTPADLLSPDIQARPERRDELLKSSHPRQPDDFDLPPPN